MGPKRDIKKALLVVLMALATLTGAYGISWAVSGASGPHTDYRTGYTSCSGNAACHAVGKQRFLPETLDNTHLRDYSNFCLTCHNTTGEAHSKPAGTPSTNVYDNLTCFKIGRSYRGVSHSWKGVNGNAGTRTPTISDFIGASYGGIDGTTYMYNGKVVCETCHVAALKTRTQEVDWAPASDLTGDQIHYTFGYANTKEYLSQYIKVYRSSTPVARPTGDTRSKKKYLVSRTEYTYNPANATITFNHQQGGTGTVYIYVDIPQPYLRSDNTGNAICLDCHNDRKDTAVNHPGGPAVRDQHPVEVSYGYASGTRDTLKNATTVKLFMEGGKVLCTTCHDPHNAPGNDGELLREGTPTALCLDCHDRSKVAVHKGPSHPKYANTTTIPTGCTECHTGHNTTNIYLVRDRFMTASGAIKRVWLRNLTGIYGLGDDSGSSVCEVCHTKTGLHRSDGSGKGHNTGKNCITCHKHERGFDPIPGGKPCYNCHDGSVGPDIKVLMGLGTTLSSGGKASRHRIALDNNTTSSCLVMCHTGDHSTLAPNIKAAPEAALCNSPACHNGGTGKTSQGRSIDIGGSFAASSHNYTTTVQDEFGFFRYNANCTKCHLPHGSDSYPNVASAINGKATNGNSEDLCFGCHDSGRSKGALDIKSLWNANPSNKGHYDYGKTRQMNCVDCHGPHGTKNDKMVRDSLGGPGLTRDAICRACHSGKGGSVYNVMGSAPGSYNNFSAVSIHDFGLRVAIGGRTVDLTCVGCHDPHNTKNARLLQDKMVFSSVSGVNTLPVPQVTAVVQDRGPILEYTNGWNSYCVLCHTQVGETGYLSPFRRHPTGVGLAHYTSDYRQYNNNAAQQPELKLESGNVSCVTCHYTHGSPQVSLLRFQNSSHLPLHARLSAGLIAQVPELHDPAQTHVPEVPQPGQVPGRRPRLARRVP